MMASSRPDPDIQLDLATLSDQLAGLVVSGVSQPDPESIEIRFANGSTLVIRPQDGGFAAILHTRKRRAGRTDDGPTHRQREYLEFIKKFMHRFGVAPAEADIQRHFLVSAPSVHQMIRTLERRGFIERDRDWYGQALPRSIRVTWEG